MPKQRKYPQVYEGEWVYPKRKGYREVCCDCGLTHRVNYRLVKTLNGGHAIQYQVFIDRRATAQIRRHLGIAITKQKNGT